MYVFTPLVRRSFSQPYEVSLNDGGHAQWRNLAVKELGSLQSL